MSESLQKPAKSYLRILAKVHAFCTRENIVKGVFIASSSPSPPQACLATAPASSGFTIYSLKSLAKFRKVPQIDFHKDSRVRKSWFLLLLQLFSKVSQWALC